MHQNSFLFIVFPVVLFLSYTPLSFSQQSAVEEFQYDALGRLVITKENGSVKTAYCYDKAGNRINVNSSGIAPEDCGTIPGVPTNLSRGSHQGGGCYWLWSAPASGGVSYYEVKLNNSETMRVSGGYAEHNSQCPIWIVACNDMNICSDRAYF